MRLKDNESFVFQHPNKQGICISQDCEWTNQTNDWARFSDEQEFHDFWIYLSAKDIHAIPSLCIQKPEQLTDGPNKGKWAIKIIFRELDKIIIN